MKHFCSGYAEKMAGNWCKHDLIVDSRLMLETDPNMLLFAEKWLDIFTGGWHLFNEHRNDDTGRIFLIGDSKHVVDWVNDSAVAYPVHLKAVAAKLSEQFAFCPCAFTRFSVSHVLRNENKWTDSLATKAWQERRTFRDCFRRQFAAGVECFKMHFDVTSTVVIGMAMAPLE